MREALAFGISLVFLSAAVLKARAFATTLRQVRSALGRAARPALILAIATELLIAVGMLLSRTWAPVLGAMFLTVASIYLGLALRMQRDHRCACWGSRAKAGKDANHDRQTLAPAISTMVMPAWYGVRNSALTFASLVSGGADPSSPRTQLVALLPTCCLVLAMLWTVQAARHSVARTIDREVELHSRVRAVARRWYEARDGRLTIYTRQPGPGAKVGNIS